MKILTSEHDVTPPKIIVIALLTYITQSNLLSQAIPDDHPSTPENIQPKT